jgi:hypothetical protein
MRPARDHGREATRLGPAFDLLAGYREGGFFLERSGLGLATSGEVDRVSAEAGPERILRLSRSAVEALAAIEAEPGSPAPAAVASIPFDDREPAEAVVPRRTTVRPGRRRDLADRDRPAGETRTRAIANAGPDGRSPTTRSRRSGSDPIPSPTSTRRRWLGRPSGSARASSARSCSLGRCS